MNIFDFFKAQYLAPLSAWTRKTPSPVYKSTYSELQVQKKGLDKADPYRRTAEKYGEHIARHVVGQQYYPKENKSYPIVKYPAVHPTAVPEPPLHYYPKFAQSQLATAPKGWETNPKYSRLINFIDAETTNLGGANILSWSRLGVTYNYEKKQFEYVSSEDRFYQPKGPFSAGAWQANRLYAQDIESARNQRPYAEHYDKNEAAYLKSQLRGSIVAGHNILNADVPWLFGHMDMSTFDTLIAAENVKGKGHNELAKLFSFFHKGMSPQKLGIQEHLSQHDVLMNVFVLEKMLQKYPELLKDFSYINKNVGAQYAPRTVLNGVKSNITMGNQYVFPKLTGDRAKYIATEADYYANINAGSDYTAKKEVDMYDEDGHFDGFHAVNEEERPDIIGLNENAMDAATQRWIDEMEGKILPSGGDIMGAKEWAEFQGMMSALTSRIGGLSDSWRDIAATRAAEQRGEILRIGSRISKYSPDERIKELRTLGIADTTEFGKNILDVAQRQAEWREEEERQHEIEKQQRATEAQQERKQEVDLQGLYEDGKLTQGQFDYLTSSVYATNISFKEFKRQLDKATKSTEDFYMKQGLAHQRGMNAAATFGKTPFYDPQALIEVGKKQWKGIQDAAGGFVPGPVMEPISHYGTAVLNAYQSGLSGIKKWTSPIGATLNVAGNTLLAGGVGTGNPALLAGGAIVKGTAALTSQIVGQHMEHKMRQRGEDLQMRLNLVSAGVQTVLLPFKLLTSASLRLAKIFGGLGAALAGVAYSGLKDMTQMGNPLTNLTGAGYNAFYNMKAGDYASLLSPGTTNSMLEDLAYGSARLYTLGQMDTNRLIASSMLGQFHNVYSTNPDSEENMTNMINGVWAQMKNADPSRKRDLMSYAAAISPALPHILQSMDTLGVDNYQQLMDPSRRGVTWTAGRGKEFMESWRKQFQWDQYEFQSIGTNIGFNKERIADKLWKSFGFTLYNGLNTVLEKVADGNWKGAMDTLGEGIKWLGEQLTANKGVFHDLWKQLKELFKTLTGGGIGDKIKELGVQIKELGIQLAESFLRGLTPLVRLMDSIKFDPWKMKFELSDIKEVSRTSKVADVISASAAGTLYDKLKAKGREPAGNMYGLTMPDLFNYLLTDGTPEEMRQLGVTPEDLKDFDTFANVFRAGDLEKQWRRLTRPGENGEHSEIGKALDTQVTIGAEAIKTAVTSAANVINNTLDNKTYVKVYVAGKEVADILAENGKKVRDRVTGQTQVYVEGRSGGN